MTVERTALCLSSTFVCLFVSYVQAQANLTDVVEAHTTLRTAGDSTS